MELTGGFVDAFANAFDVFAKSPHGGTAGGEGDNQRTGERNKEKGFDGFHGKERW